MGNLAEGEVTRLLLAWSNGDRSALDSLTPIVYRELHRLAGSCMKGEHAGHTLQTTALVNEAYMRLVDYKGMQWQNRTHFFCGFGAGDAPYSGGTRAPAQLEARRPRSARIN